VVPNPDGWPFEAPTAARLQTGKPLTLELGDGVSMELKFIPAGQFVAGQPGGHPSETPRAVEIKSPFWIGSCEVTNEQFARFDPTHESRFEHKGSWVFSEGHLGWPLDGPRQPVVRVSQTEAAAFCRWISEKSGMHASLPDEDQWEWACRAGSATPFSFGGLDDDFSAHANLADATIRQLAYDTDGRNTVDMVPRDGRFNDGWLVTAPVGSYQPNPWGLHDMHGNVWEWTRSGFGGTAESVARGGSWRDRPKLGTSACRIHYPGWQKVYNVGFRVVVAPPNP
jgi:formylglycine-generating enzyme required for sulfatase activity